jgi:hypothetical protein
MIVAPGTVKPYMEWPGREGEKEEGVGALPHPPMT